MYVSECETTYRTRMKSTNIRQIAGRNENVTNDRIINFLMTINYIINLLDIIVWNASFCK